MSVTAILLQPLGRRSVGPQFSGNAFRIAELLLGSNVHGSTRRQYDFVNESDCPDCPPLHSDLRSPRSGREQLSKEIGLEATTSLEP
jgi:hypothetical protein